ncbi:MAG: hypothetical protein ICV70_01855 [Jiangellaceae bacterium]|nr:hypothetical protein [Jiangellaceae bacterium]
MDQRSPQPVGPPPSWPRVILNTLRLSRERRRRHPRDLGDDRPPPPRRLWIPVAVGVAVVIGVGFLVKALIEWDATEPSVTGTPLATVTQSPSVAVPSGLPTGPARTGPPANPTVPGARAAAGAEIANRADIDVSGAAAEALEQGIVDGRVLMVLAALANADQLITVDVAPTATSDPAGPPNLEMGVIDVDAVLDWLDAQPQLRPDRLVVRRESDVAYIRPAYDTPEPSGLFPS